MLKRDSKIYRDTAELLAWLEEQNCPSAVLKALKDINCDEWTLCNNDEETLLEELKLSKLQLRALFKIINGSSSSSTRSTSSSSNSAPANRPQIVSDMFDNKYINNGLLGSGGFGKVYKVSLKDKPHINRAIKIIEDRLEFTVNEALKEVIQTMKVAHKHVVQIHDVIITNNHALMIEMECCDYGSLHDYFIKKRIKPSPKMTTMIALQVLEALEFIQNNFKMVHRDVKPGNILIRSIDLDKDEIIVCLADFGFAKSFEYSSQISGIRGTFSYLAPEISLVFENDEVGSVQPYTIASDIYALGATLFCLLTFNLFNRNNSKLLSTLDGYPSNLSTSILKMLSINPIDRDLGIITSNISIELDSLDKRNGVDMYNLGMKYKNGTGCEKSYEKAFEWFQKSANQGNAYAQNSLGDCYYYGEGTEQDYKKAFEWFQQSAEQGNADGQNSLGVCYYDGNGIEQDYKKAFEWFQKSANQGNAYGQNSLGDCYNYGKGTVRDYKKAFEWYQKSAEQGNADGQNSLGVRYYTGNGIEQDYKKAFEWFQKSAEQGNAYGQNMLGICYNYGKGTTQDYKKAFEWYQKSAEQGNPYSQNWLGICYNYGYGTTQDYKKAFEWYQKSANQGNSDAKERLEQLRKSNHELF